MTQSSAVRCWVVRFATVVAVLFCAATGQAQGTPVRVLFVGNSYTMFNDMPNMLSEMGRSLGYDIRPEVRGIGGASLSAHRRNAKTLRALMTSGWDAVILQDHSLRPSKHPAELQTSALPDVRFLAQLARRHSPAARIIYYATWGRRDGDQVNCLARPIVCSYDGHTEALRRGYAMYQSATGGRIAPVGTVWQRVIHDRSGARPFDARRLWVSDGSHPSRYGSYLAAATILRTLSGRPVASSEYCGNLPCDAAKYLRRAADTQALLKDRHHR